jgi:hypothetical protein
MTEDQKQIASLIAQARHIMARLAIIDQRYLHREQNDE